MSTFIYIVLGVFAPVLAPLIFLLWLSANVAVIYGIVCIVEWVSNMRKRAKRLRYLRYLSKTNEDMNQPDSDSMSKQNN